MRCPCLIRLLTSALLRSLYGAAPVYSQSHTCSCVQAIVYRLWPTNDLRGWARTSDVDLDFLLVSSKRSDEI